MTKKKYQKKDIPPIDYPSVLERIGGDESFLEELLNIYFEDFPKKCNQLKEAIEQKEFDLIHEIGHYLKGSSANLSLTLHQQASSHMETAGKERNIDEASIALDLLEQEFKRLKDFLTKKKGQIHLKRGQKNDSENSSSEFDTEKLERLSEEQVLAADDSMDNQLLLKYLSARVGITIDVASNGKEAIELFLKKKYSLILLDIHMPEINGFEALEEMKSIEKEKDLSPTPIIALTGSSLPGDRTKCLSLGFDDYVEKPLKKDKYLKILNKYSRTHYRTPPSEDIHIDESIKDLIPDYLKRRKNDAKNMKKALRGSDLSTVESIAHKMKGSGESYGFKKISQLGQQIEKSAQEKDHEKTKRLLEAFEDYLSNLFARMNQ